MSDQCAYLHEDYCTLTDYCYHQIPVFQDGVQQTFPGCNATTADLVDGTMSDGITERVLTMKIQFPSTMREEGIRRYILSQIFIDGWGEAFKTNYIHVEPVTVKLSTVDK